MNTEKLTQILIGHSSGLKNALTEVSLGYDLIYGVIEKEHAAILSHNLPQIEELIDQKNQVGEIIEVQTNAMQGIALSLKCTYEEHTNKNWIKTLGMSDCHEMLHELTQIIKNDSLAYSILNNAMRKLQRTISQFHDRLASIKPKIEVNAMALKKLLTNHQESYYFFLGLCEKEAASYNAHGKKTQGPSSTLSVKA